MRLPPASLVCSLMATTACAGDVYNADWTRIGHVRDGDVFDANDHLIGRIRDGSVFDAKDHVIGHTKTAT